MSGTTCDSCTRQMHDAATVCEGCTDRVFMELRTVAEVCDDLLTTLTRQDKIEEREGGAARSREVPLPWRESAAEAAWVLHASLLAWVSTLSEGDVTVQALIGQSDRSRYVENEELALWLLRHRDTFRRHPMAASAVEELLEAVRNARRTVDRPAALVYRGPCDECGQDLYVPGHLAEVTCRACAATYDAEARRAWLVDRIDSHLATPVEIARGVSTLLGREIKVDTIYKWIERKRLLQKGVDPRTRRALYAIGDVVTLVTAENSPRRSA